MIKLATNLSKLYSLRNKTAEENPYWARIRSFAEKLMPAATGIQSFYSAFDEPFSGAAHYWTGGRIGSDYPEDSMWIDTNRRLLNALPGRTQYELRYEDPMLDAAAASLGVSGLAAGAAPVALAAPYVIPAATTILTAAPRARQAVDFASNVGKAIKTYGGPLVLGTAPQVIGDAVSVAGPAVQNVNKYQADAYQSLLDAGYSAAEAASISHKMGWGGLMHAGKEYLSNPYHYIYRQGGDNPIDRTFVDMMANPLPHDVFTAAREGLSVAASGPVGAPIKAVGYGALNQLESMPGATTAALQEAQRQAAQPNAQMPTLESARNALDNSRFYQSMRDYYGKDFGSIATHYGFNTLNRGTAYPSPSQPPSSALSQTPRPATPPKS